MRVLKTPNDVQSFMPRIKELLEVGVKNDEQIIKLAAVVQRLQSTQVEIPEDMIGLTNEDKEQLMQARIRELEALSEINKELKSQIPDSSITKK